MLDIAPAKLTDKAIDSIIHANARLNIWDGSVRSTKTVTSILRWLDYVAHEAPPGDLLISGKTRDTIRRNVLNPIEEIARGSVRWSISSGEGQLLGRRFYVIGGSDESSELRLRGLTLAGAYIDEITTIPRSFFMQTLARMSITDAMLFGSTNPDSPYHWLKTDFLDKKRDLDLAHFHFTLNDNPWLSEEYKDALKAEYGVGSLWYRRFVEGLWVVAEGAIYDMWDARRHVTSKLPNPEHISAAWSAVDYGTTNPFVALIFCVVDHPRPHIEVVAEWRWDSQERRSQMTDAGYSKALTEWLDKVRPLIARDFPDGAHPSEMLEYLYVDPSAASFILQCEADGFSRVARANNDVLDGIRGVSTLLSTDRLKFHESCDGTIKEMPSYSWDPKAQQRGEDKPLKRDDHGPDATRYGIWSEQRKWQDWTETAK